MTPPPFDPFARQNARGRGAPESTEFPPCFPLRFFFASVSFDGVRMFPFFHSPAPNNPNCTRFEARGKNARAARAKKMPSKRMYFTSKCTAFRFFPFPFAACTLTSVRVRLRGRFRTRRAFPVSGAVIPRGRLRFDGIFARRARFWGRAFFFVRRRSVCDFGCGSGGGRHSARATRPRGSLALACGVW